MSVHDRWGGARTGSGHRWEVRWRDGTKQRKRRFANEKAARRFNAERMLDPHLPDYRPLLTVGEMVDSYLAGIGGLRPKTQDDYRYRAGKVREAFGDRLASSLRPSEVRAWAARSDASAVVRHKALSTLRVCYRLAIADRLLALDPTEGVALPKLPRSDMRFLSWAELEQLAEACGDHAGLVMLLGTCGLRIGEALGIEQSDVDRLRRRIRIRRSWSVSSSGRELGPTKGSQARDVPVTASVMAMLPDRIGPLFVGVHGDRLDPHWWRAKVFRPAAVAAGLGAMHPHELRHTAASLAIQSGADVKVVQRLLGHNSAAMTLDLYGHLFDTALDTVADRMDEARTAQMGRTATAKGAVGAQDSTNSDKLRLTSAGGGGDVISMPTRANTS